MSHQIIFFVVVVRTKLLIQNKITFYHLIESMQLLNLIQFFFFSVLICNFHFAIYHKDLYLCFEVVQLILNSSDDLFSVPKSFCGTQMKIYKIINNLKNT